MTRALVDFFEALDAFAAAPQDDAARRAVMVKALRADSDDAWQMHQWPRMALHAIRLGHLVGEIKPGSARLSVLARLAQATRDAIEADIGDVFTPTTPAAPILSYKDD